MSKLPEFGWQGLYKGSTPAILGQFFGCAPHVFTLFFVMLLYIADNYIYAHVIAVSLDCSHGLRTGIFEASKLLVINIAPTLPNMQVRHI